MRSPSCSRLENGIFHLIITQPIRSNISGHITLRAASSARPSPIFIAAAPPPSRRRVYYRHSPPPPHIGPDESTLPDGGGEGREEQRCGGRARNKSIHVWGIQTRPYAAHSAHFVLKIFHLFHLHTGEPFLITPKGQ